MTTPTPDYVELHLHTAFSFLDGASLPEEMAGRAADLGYRALAITDHDNVHGAMEFTKAAQAVGIQPITGAEVTLLDGSHLTLLAETPAGYANLCRLLTAAHGAPLDATPLWPPAYADPAGYPDASPDDDGVDAPDDGVDAPGPIPATRTPGAPRRSRRPNTPAAERVPRLDPALLGSHAEGLILLTGCRRGDLSGLVDDDRLPEAEALLRRYLDWFGTGQVVVELQHNHVHGDARRVARLVGLAGRLGLPHAATGNVHYHHRDRHRLQDVVTAIRHRTTLDGCHRERRPNAEFALRPIPEVVELFRPYPAAVRTTLDLAERCAGFDLSRDLAYRFPDYPTDPGETPDDLLARVCRAALDRRYPPGPAPVQDATPVPSPAPGRDPTSSSGFTLVIEPAPRRGDTTTPHRSGTRRSVPTSPPVVPPPASRVTAVDRLEEELGLIARHGLAGFFLLYRDLLELARSVATGIRGTGTPRDAGNLPPGRGRGSSVSSIVCYLIGLSPVDPLAHGLFLGRFLNEEIASVPDIDIDFPRDIRDRLIERVYEVFGADRVAMVCAFSTYRLRSAVRDIGKALGLPPADLDRIAKLSEPRSARELAAELDRIPEYAARKDTPPWCYLIELAGQLAGFPRHVTQHSGGMIVSSTPLNRIVPIQPAAMPGRYICQWDKDSCDDARLVKIDFLALGMLSLVEECLDLIPAAGKPPVDLSRIDFTDTAVYDMICAGDTIGTFQIESRAQIQTLLRTHPRTIEDLTVQVAIVRPGPIIGGAVNPYVNLRQRARRGLDARPTYDHPSLEPILRETLGVILYQEQVLQVAMALSGFTAGQADQLRRAMSRKRSREAMIRLWEQFRDGAYGRGVDPETTRTVFKKLIGFATYGFPKCHSVAFAVLAYQSSWLKHYYPAEFMAALLNNQPMGFYPPHVLTNDAKRHGIRILPPDVNASAARCVVEGNAVRIGLGYVDGLGEEAAGRIERERMEHGPFLSLADLVRRVPLRTAAAEALVAVGSCDGFGLGRREALWQLGLFIPTRRFGPIPSRHGPVPVGPANGAAGDDGRKDGRLTGRQMPLALPTGQDIVSLPPMSAWDQMATDYETLGLSPRYHPLGLLRPHLPADLVTTEDLRHRGDGLVVRIAGLIVCRQRPGTAKGITFLLLEDEHGLINVIVYPDLYDRERLLVRGEPFLTIEGKVQHRGGTLNVLAQRLWRLDRSRAADGALDHPGAPGRPEGESHDTTAPARTPGALAPTSHDYR